MDIFFKDIKNSNRFESLSKNIENKNNINIFFDKDQYTINNKFSFDFMTKCLKGEIKEPLRINEYYVPLKIKNVSNCTIDFNNSLLLLNGYMEAIEIENSENIEIKNLYIDMVRRPYTISRIVNIELHNNIFKIKMVNDSVIYENTPILRMVMYSLKEDRFYQGMRCINFTKTDDGFIYEGYFDLHPEIGDEFIFIHNFLYRPAIYIKNSKNITINNICVYSQVGHAIGSYETENINIYNVKVIPRKGDHYSTGVDALHLVSSKGNVIVKDSTFEYCGDDGLNIHSYFLNVINYNNDKAKIHFNHISHFNENIIPSVNDEIEVIQKDNFKPIISTRIKEIIQNEDKTYTITLDSPLPSTNSELLLYNKSYVPSLEFIGNKVHCAFTRGLLIKCNNAIVKNNNFIRCGISGIKISSEDLMWMESSPPKNVLIDGNSIIDCGYIKRFEGTETWGGIIATSDALTHNSYKSLQNIQIINNDINCKHADFGLYLRDIDNVILKNNNIIGNIFKENISD